ncbi:ABC transporter ATP-binding protein [Minwuia thermotolerans]|uniref:ABC transporter n=1 Tax=Minwuia thermotolerans TaxID=2056226 RepID=A0A2M9G601_9PROT|nr:ABC transporter ATP-binding protein [Minwuia thermotolerans]PJK31132.1 ABC transporter [Minwuia thermotolerans]
MEDVPLLELNGVARSFPGVVANRDVSLAVGRGSIHALLGENGAGKSTLVKIIYGVLRPDAGQMFVNGRRHRPQKPADARAAGIGMVFQHFSLFDAMTVEENIALGLPADAIGDDLEHRIRAVSAEYGLKVDPTRRVDDLSVGEKQRVEIVRCLLQSPSLLIMDEPTSVLTPQEAEKLFDILRRLRDRGCSVLYISHKLDEIRAICDAATVLRRGEVVARCDPRKETARSLAAMMIGAELPPPRRAKQTPGDVRLKVDDLSLPAVSEFGTALRGISFELRAGEILGIGGVAGNGQTELMEALIGERPSARRETIVLDGKPVGTRGPVGRRARGMAFVPEERIGHGAVSEMSLAENAIISARGGQGLVRRGFLSFLSAAGYAKRVIEVFRVAATGASAPAGSLSGGNLQKFVVGREVLQEPGVLIAAQPTWGVDAGSAAEIHAALDRLAAAGAAVLVISQDLDELLAISDRFAVLSEGRLSRPRPTGELDIETIGLMMGGRLEEAA